MTTVTNLISPDAFYNGNNFRSTSGLVKTLQSEAIDELFLRTKPLATSFNILLNPVSGVDTNNGFTLPVKTFVKVNQNGFTLPVKTFVKVNQILNTYDWNHQSVTIDFNNTLTTAAVLDGNEFTNLNLLTLSTSDNGRLSAAFTLRDIDSFRLDSVYLSGAVSISLNNIDQFRSSLLVVENITSTNVFTINSCNRVEIDCDSITNLVNLASFIRVSNTLFLLFDTNSSTNVSITGAFIDVLSGVWQSIKYTKYCWIDFALDNSWDYWFSS